MKTETLIEEDGIEYERGHDQWSSHERNIPLGTVRYIDDKLYVSWLIYPKLWRKPRIVWRPLAARNLPTS